MDPGWYYNRIPAQHVVTSAGATGSPGLGAASMSGASAGEAVLQSGGYAAAAQHPIFLAQQIRDAAEAAQMSQYQNMGLPPSLVQAASKTQLHQQALANLNMRESVISAREVAAPAAAARENFLTPPQTPVSSLGWKSGGAGAVIVPEPHKAADPRSIVNNVMRGAERPPYADVNGGGSAVASVNGGANNGAATAGGRGNMRQAVELKSSQPIFPGQPPPLAARTSAASSSSSSSQQPPPRQSSQVRVPSRSSSSSSSSNRTAFPGQAPPQSFSRGGGSSDSSFLHDIAGHHRQSPQQQQQQPSPQYYNNPSPQNVASPQTQLYQQNPSPQHQQQQQFSGYHHPQQKQQQTQQRPASTSSSSSRHR